MNDDPDMNLPAPTPEHQDRPAPMGIGRVLEVGVEIMRRQWAVLLAIALVLVGPVALLSAALSNRFFDVVQGVFPEFEQGVIEDATLTSAEAERLLGALGEWGIGAIIAGVLTSIATLGFSAVVGSDYHHQPLGLGGTLRRALQRTPMAIVYMVLSTAVVVAIVVAGLIAGGAALTLLSGDGSGGPGAFVALIVAVAVVLAVVYLTIRWTPALPMIANEPVGWRKMFGRSWHLTTGNVARTLAVLILANVIVLLIGWVLSLVLMLLLADVVAAAVGLDPAVARVVASAATSVLLAPFAAVWVAVLYYDLRARRDPPGSVQDLSS